MRSQTRQRLVALHRTSFQRFGYTPDSLFWSSRGIQKTRFRVLAGIGVRKGDSLLDVGCGFADLAGWLKGNDLTVDYHGIDISPEILGQAARLNPDLSLRCGDLFDFDFQPGSFDWAVLSGTLNWDLHDGGDYARRLIARMFALCRSGVALNMLDARRINPAMLGDLIAYEPEQMLAHCRTIAPDSTLRDDYLDNDFTIYMRR